MIDLGRGERERRERVKRKREEEEKLTEPHSSVVQCDPRSNKGRFFSLFPKPKKSVCVSASCGKEEEEEDSKLWREEFLFGKPQCVSAKMWLTKGLWCWISWIPLWCYFCSPLYLERRVRNYYSSGHWSVLCLSLIHATFKKIPFSSFSINFGKLPNRRLWTAVTIFRFPIKHISFFCFLLCCFCVDGSEQNFFGFFYYPPPPPPNPLINVYSRVRFMSHFCPPPPPFPYTVRMQQQSLSQKREKRQKSGSGHCLMGLLKCPVLSFSPAKSAHIKNLVPPVRVSWA